MTDTVIWLCGSQRSCSNAVGLALLAAGAQSHRTAIPQSSEWNEVYSDDPWILHHTDMVAGHSWKDKDNPGSGANPEPIDIYAARLGDAEFWGVFRQYVRGRFDLCTAPYLFKCNAGCAVYQILHMAFPEGTKHILITTWREQAKRVASLAARTQCSQEECRAYLDRFDRSLHEMEQDVARHGWVVCRVGVDELIKDREHSIKQITSLCGLTATQEAIDIFNPAKLRF